MEPEGQIFNLLNTGGPVVTLTNPRILRLALLFRF
jgi:hypothetical protein